MVIRRITTFLFFGLSLSFLLTSAHAQQWWRDPFGVSNKYQENQRPGRAPTAEEELNARYIYEDGLKDLEEGRLREAKKKFNEVSKFMRRTEVAPAALLKKAQVLRRQEKNHKAFKTAQQVIAQYPDYPGFNEVIRTQFEIATTILEGDRGKILYIFPKFNNMSRSRRYFETVIRNAPFSDYAAMSLMNIAMVSEKVGEEEYAIDALDRLINFYPDSLFGPDAYYMMGDVFAKLVDGPFYDQSSTEEAISYYEDFLLLFPNNPRAEDAEEGLQDMQEVLAQSKYLLGEFYYRYRFNTTAALVYYNETITVVPTSNAARIAKNRIDRIREGQPPPRSGLGIAQIWNSLTRPEEPFRDAELIRREQEELEKAEETEVLPATPSPQG